MKFDLYGHELEYSSGVENYNYIKVNNEKFIQTMEQEFESDYYKSFSNIQEALGNIEEFELGYIVKVVDWGIEFLNNNGVHKYNRQRFFEKYGKDCYESLNNEIVRLKQQYYAIENEQEEAARYREERKESRGRWEGGGFGLEGAVKGVITAGAANMATGLAHSAINAVGNIGSSISAYNQKKEMYENKTNVRRLRDSTAYTMRYAYEFIVQITEDETNIPIERPKWYSNDLQAQAAVIDNIKKGYIKGKETILAECAKILQDNPYNEDAYNQFMTLCDDPKKQIEDMSVYFGLSTFADSKKRELKEYLDNINYYDRKELQEGKEKTLEWAIRFGIDTSSIERCFDSVDKLLEENDKKVDGFVYDSIELANKEKNRIESIVARINNTKGNDVETISDIIREIEDADFMSKEKYISFLKKELEEEDIRFRTVLGELYSTREEAALAREEAKTLKDAFSNLVIDSEAKLQELQELVKNTSTVDLKEIYTSYLDKCKELLEHQKAQIGTNVDFNDKLRKEYASFFYRCYLYYRETEFVHVMLPEYEVWFDNLFTQYRTVNGKVFKTPLEADAAYIKLIEHARSYLKYITEKKAEKKSFFGALKTGVTGIVYKNYEPEYNIVTENGTKSIPEDHKEDYDRYIKSSATATDKVVENSRQKIEDATKRIKMSCEMQNKKINASRLIDVTKPVDALAVSNIMKECCQNISVKNNPKLLEVNNLDDNECVEPEVSLELSSEIEDFFLDIPEKSNVQVSNTDKASKSTDTKCEDSSDMDEMFEALDYVKNNFTPNQRAEAIRYLTEHIKNKDSALAEVLIDDIWN